MSQYHFLVFLGTDVDGNYVHTLRKNLYTKYRNGNNMKSFEPVSHLYQKIHPYSLNFATNATLLGKSSNLLMLQFIRWVFEEL